jgi:hypothetical protein
VPIRANLLLNFEQKKPRNDVAQLVAMGFEEAYSKTVLRGKFPAELFVRIVISMLFQPVTGTWSTHLQPYSPTQRRAAKKRQKRKKGENYAKRTTDVLRCSLTTPATQQTLSKTRGGKLLALCNTFYSLRRDFIRTEL